MIQRPAVPRVEKIREEVSTKLSTDSTTSSASTMSSTSSVVRTDDHPVEQNLASKKFEEPKR
jgi:hypothetical protein